MQHDVQELCRVVRWWYANKTTCSFSWKHQVTAVPVIVNLCFYFYLVALMLHVVRLVIFCFPVSAREKIIWIEIIMNKFNWDKQDRPSVSCLGHFLLVWVPQFHLCWPGSVVNFLAADFLTSGIMNVTNHQSTFWVLFQ